MMSKPTDASIESIIIEDMYTSNVHYLCDRSKNYLCPRVKKNLPCGNCKGTKYIEFAKVFNRDDKILSESED